jgi:transcriptional regulator with XRE-family HTH domain
MTFAEKLRALREQAGLSEAKLADLASVSFGAVHNYGLGIRTPTFPAVVKLARALGVTCEAFADCEDIASPDSPKGRPRKPPAAAQETPRAGKASEDTAGKKRAPRGKRKGKRE